MPTPTPLVFATPSIPAGAAAARGQPGRLRPAVSSHQQPAAGPGATLPPGDIVIGARVTGSSDLTDIIAYVDGEAIPIDLGAAPRCASRW